MYVNISLHTNFILNLQFIAVLIANVTYDGDKESEGEEDEVSGEDSRKVSLTHPKYTLQITCNQI